MSSYEIVQMAIRMHQEEARLNHKMVPPLDPIGLMKIVEVGLVDGDYARFGKYRFWLGIDRVWCDELVGEKWVPKDVPEDRQQAARDRMLAYKAYLATKQKPYETGSLGSLGRAAYPGGYTGGL